MSEPQQASDWMRMSEEKERIRVGDRIDTLHCEKRKRKLRVKSLLLFGIMYF